MDRSFYLVVGGWWEKWLVVCAGTFQVDRVQDMLCSTTNKTSKHAIGVGMIYFAVSTPVIETGLLTGLTSNRPLPLGVSWIPVGFGAPEGPGFL